MAAFMRYFRAKERESDHDAVFRLYMAKGMELVAEAMAGVKLTDFGELISDEPVDTRSGDEIAADIIKRAGLRVGGD